MTEPSLERAGEPERSPVRISPAAWYALTVLTIANILNYVDRQLPAILAESIKQDLKLTDTQLGFLFGTTFVVLFAVFGVPMGRIADQVSRRRLMAAGLSFWSAMTSLAGFATSFGQLAAARLGVGIGEATATPCAVSMLYDSVPAKNRSGVLGVYLVGTSVGAGLALLVGGWLLDVWPTVCTVGAGLGACSLKPWQGAFLVVGLPGIFCAVLVLFIREPVRIRTAPPQTLPKLLASEFSAAIPPFTLFALGRLGGAPEVIRNLMLVAGLALGACLLALATGDWAQWIGVAIGAYSVITWGQNLRLRDRPLFKLTLGCRTFMTVLLGVAIPACLNNSVHFWAVPYAIRELGFTASEAGLWLGLAIASASILGVSLGGVITDRWKRHDPRAPIWMILIAAVCPVPALALMFMFQDPQLYIAGVFLHAFIGMSHSGGATALMQDLVLPRMRGSAASTFSLIVILTALALGPYATGKISTVTGSLQTGIIGIHLILPVAVIVLLYAAKMITKQSPAGRQSRAESFGEPEAAGAVPMVA